MTAQYAPTQNFTDSLHTPTDEEGTVTSDTVQLLQQVYFSICYEPIAYFLESADMALIIQRIHYWLQNEKSGYLFRDGRKRIFSGYIELAQQFPWLSVDQLGRMIRRLEQIGWLVSDRFYNLKRHVGFIGPVPQMQEDNQRKWYYLDYQQIFQDTGFDLLFGKDPEGRQPKRARRANLQNCIDHSANLHPPICNSADTSIYKELRRSSKTISNDHDQKEKIDSPVVESQESSSESTETTTTSDNCQEFSEVLESSEEVNHTPIEPPVKVNIPRRAATKLNKRQKFEWEVEVNRPHSDFVRWRANTHYTPQGNHWAAGAISNAFSEIVNKSNNCPEKAQALWEQFLEYAKHSADTAQVRIDNGMEAWLPSCFDEKPQLDAQEVGKSVLAVKQQIQQEQAQALPASQQQQTQALPGQPAQEPEQNPGPPLKFRVEWRRTLWKGANAKDQAEIRRWAENTPGVVMTPEGPALAPEGESNVDTCAGSSSVSADSQQSAETPAAPTPKAPTLAEQVKCRRLVWGSPSVAPEVRQQIQHWAETTPGVVMTPDGPALE